MERLNTETIRELAEAAGPCVTVVLQREADLRPAIDALRREKQDQAGDLLDSVQKLAAQSTGGPIAILASPSVTRVFRAPKNIPHMAHIGDRFNLRAILAIAAGRRLFHIVALSQNRSRILECTEDSAEEVPFPSHFAANYSDAMQTRQPDHVLDGRASGGPSMGAGHVMFGTSSDKDDKPEYLRHFFGQLDKAVNAFLKGSNDPLIAVGVEHELAIYRSVNTYPYTVEPGVSGAPDGLEGGEMHRRALALLIEKERETGTQVAADFDKRVGDGHASIHIHDIVVAAFEGRVLAIFFQENAKYSGTFDAVRQLVKRTEDPLESPIDLIDEAVRQTLLHGGSARLLPAAAMPNGVPICALFRYPAP